jgi:hypothetical protein
VYQVSVPRAEAAKDNGMEVPEAMGSAIAINFQPTDPGKAATTGDFVLTADEVNPVIKALQANGVEVTAVHNHTLSDEPRLVFMPFWANDDVQTLAKGLRAASTTCRYPRAKGRINEMDLPSSRWHPHGGSVIGHRLPMRPSP